jgi:cytochrome P450
VLFNWDFPVEHEINNNIVKNRYRKMISFRDVLLDGITIPKGVTVFLFTHGIHMNPRFYPDPDKFDPSRFDDDKERKPFAFIPFGAGLRSC